MGDSVKGKTVVNFYDGLDLSDSNRDRVSMNRTASLSLDTALFKRPSVQDVQRDQYPKTKIIFDHRHSTSSDAINNSESDSDSEDVSSSEEGELENPWNLANRFISLKSPMENMRLALSRANPIPEARSDDTCFKSPNASGPTGTGRNKSWPPDRPDIHFASPSYTRSSNSSSTGTSVSDNLRLSASSCPNSPWDHVDHSSSSREKHLRKSRYASFNSDSLLSLSSISNAYDGDRVFRNYTPDMSPLATSTPEKYPTSKERPPSHKEKFDFIFSNSNSTIPGYMRSTDKNNRSSIKPDGLQQLSFHLEKQPKQKSDSIQFSTVSVTDTSSHEQHPRPKSINRQLFSPDQVKAKLKTPKKKLKTPQQSPARRKLFMTEDEEAVHYLVTKYLNNDST